MTERFDPSGWRSLLFVPGARPDRFEKAAAAGADLVCIDLEDAVAPAGKDEARRETLAFLAQHKERGPMLGLRVNAVGSREAAADLEALAGAEGIDFVMVPKVINTDELTVVADAFGHPRLIPVLEQARAIQRVDDLADHPAVCAAIYGAIDLSADIGATLDWDPHLYGRSRCVIAFAAARKVLFDVPYLDVEDEAGLIESTKRAQALGLHARAAIHPRQIPPIHAALAPSEEDIAHAQRVVEAYENSTTGLAMLDGKLVELPVLKSAQRVLAAAKR